jgi:hypothetical protein
VARRRDGADLGRGPGKEEVRTNRWLFSINQFFSENESKRIGGRKVRGRQAGKVRRSANESRLGGMIIISYNPLANQKERKSRPSSIIAENSRTQECPFRMCESFSYVGGNLWWAGRQDRSSRSTLPLSALELHSVSGSNCSGCAGFRTKLKFTEFLV